MKISCDCDKCEFKHLEKGLCEEARQEEFKDILNPWRDAEKEKPDTNENVLCKTKDLDGKPHTLKPDLDNLIKAFQDSLLDNDSFIHTYKNISKIWGYDGKIIIN